MAGMENWEQLAILSQEAVKSKEQRLADLSIFDQQKDFRRYNRIQELSDRADEVGGMTFFPEEEVRKLLLEIEAEKSALLLVQNGHSEINTDWKEVTIDIAKDLIIPDEIDIVLFLATGPAGPTLSKIAKVPKALGKLVSHIPPEAKKYLRESLEAFNKEGNPEPLNKLAIALRKTPDPLNHELAEKIESTIGKQTMENGEKRVAREVEKKTESLVKPEPKATELTEKEIMFFDHDLRALSWMKNDLHKVYAGWIHEGMKGIEVLYTVGQKQLEIFERFVVYQRDIKKVPTKELEWYVSDYLEALRDVIESYWKWSPQLRNVEDAKKYFSNLKSTHGNPR